MAKREFGTGEAPDESTKKAKFDEASLSEPSLNSPQRVLLNSADCDLDFNIEGNSLQGSALYEHGFAYCWSGARANVGIIGGKYCFGCKVICAQPVDMEDTPVDQQNVCRLGISRGDDNVGNLGESEYSFGYGGTGKFSNAGKFSDFGEKYGIGDTVVCAVDLENKPLASIGFAKNGKWLGKRHFNAGPNGLGVLDCPTRKLQWGSAVFPYVMLKNVVVELQFSIDDGLVPEAGYKTWVSALEEGNALMGPSFSTIQDSEVIMMVGLPASGKSTWTEKWVEEHPEKRYVVLGTNLALDQMKVPGLLRKQNYGERFDRLMNRATEIFNTLLARATAIPRNYILDQTNVYKSARKRKLKPFVKFKKIAVVVFPKPDELKFRAAKRFKEMGKEVPSEAINEIIANYVLPMSKDMAGTDEYFDEVIFPELDRMESQRYLSEMKRDLHTKSNSPYPQSNSQSNTSVQNSQESSVHSCNNPSLQYGPLLDPVANTHGQSYYPSRPLRSVHHADQSRPVGYFAREDIYADQIRPGGFLAMEDIRSYGGYDNPGTGMASAYIGIADPYGTYAMGDSYRGTNVGSSAILPSVPDYSQSCRVQPYASTPLYPYNTGGRQTGVSGSLRADLPAPGQPMFPAGTPTTDDGHYTTSYNTTGVYSGVPGSVRADLPAPGQPISPAGTPFYGTTYSSPAIRSSYGNFPSQMQHSGGYVLSMRPSGESVPPERRYY